MTTMFAPLFEKRLRICGMIAACAMAAGFAGAQSPAPRILSEITSSAQAPLKGSRHPQAQPQNDAGRMPADRQLSGITMYFNRSAAQQADLDALIEAQQDPASPLYHQWLTPDEFAARFGMAQSDLEKVQSWLQQQGFAIDSVSRSRNAIRFSGSVGQVESAFGTQMRFFQAGGVRHFAPATELSVPASISAAVATVRNLSDFRPTAQHVVPRGSLTSQFTSGQSGNVFFAPADIATTYDVKPLYSAGVDGTGQTIVIAGQSFVSVSDIENFQSAAGLTKKDPQLVLMPGTGASTTSAGDQGESDLDLEWSTAMAPGANIVFIYTGSNTAFGVYDSVQYAVDEKIGQIISLSYASCETEITAADLTSLEGVFSQAAAQGQTVISASGDQGSTACSGDTHLTTAQQQAIAVNYPASSAFVTGMGGTEITAANSTSSNSTYWIAASGSDVLSSAKTWIPEVVWNDNSTQFGLSATGGGTSTLVSRPSWQTGVPGIASGTFRLVPDISLYSSPGLPGYLYCTSDTSNWNTTSAPIQTASCNSGFRDLSTGELTVAGGTSFAAPIFAGMLALINQKASYVTGQGQVNPTLYKLAATSATYASAFHDVTSGNNNCSVGGTICGSTTTGFSAGTGYDEVTGLGSVDLNNLATAWPVNTGTSAGLKSTTTTVIPANATPDVNVADTFTITVAQVSGTGTPTGSVTLQIDGGALFGGTTVTGQTLTANGTVTYSATFTTSGSHQVLAQYLGDATHAPSTGVGSVLIAGATPKGSFTMSATPLTVAQGSSGDSTITVTPAGGYLGTVNLTFTTSNNTALTNLCYSFITNVATGGGSVAVTGTTAVTTQLTLDARASDCVTAAAVTKSGKRPVRIVSSGNRSKNTGTNPLPAEFAFAGLLLAGFLGRSSRKFRNLACVMALAAAGFALTACGSSSTTNTSATNPPKGTYTITVTGTDSVSSTITANTTFTFIIN
jgi:subtilase family serine protease